MNPKPLFRFPYGARDARTIRIVNALGYGSIGWTVDTLGWQGAAEGATAKDVVGRVVSGLKPGAIILMHVGSAPDGSTLDAEALPKIIRRLRRKGYRFVRLDRFVARHNNYPLQVGSDGPLVRALQQSLASQTYDAGASDGRFGSMTQQAVIAFEKVHGLERDGTVGPAELRRILRASPPKAPERDLDDFIDVDIQRQVLFEVRDGRVQRTLPISTGNGATYQSNSGPAIARTPRGSFAITGKVAGWKIGYLGGMYYPSYFYGGYAIHGSISVPAYPASHGCIRIPMDSAVGFFERNPIGTPVFVHD